MFRARPGAVLEVFDGEAESLALLLAGVCANAPTLHPRGEEDGGSSTRRLDLERQCAKAGAVLVGIQTWKSQAALDGVF